MKPPKVTKVNHGHSMPGEQLVEFVDGTAGGLISIQRIDGNDGRATIQIHIYNYDPDQVSISAAYHDVTTK